MIGKRFLQLFLFLFLLSCVSNKVLDNGKNNTENKSYNNALNHIINNTSFIEALKSSYSDLNSCEKINFIPAQYTKSLSLNFFQKEELIKTSYFSKFSKLNYLEFDKEKKEYDSISKKDSNLITFNHIREKNNSENCKLLLTFSKITKNILVVEYKIIDANIDSRIVYTPRKGYYLIEFNDKQKIVNEIYNIFNW